MKEAIETYKTEVIKNQQKYLKEAQEKKDDIETRKAVMMECFKESDKFMKTEDPIDIIHYSKGILLSVEESVKVGEGEKSLETYETKMFQPRNHDNFNGQVVGKLVTEEKMINMPGPTTWKIPPVRPIWKMPVKGTLVKSWQTGSIDGYSLAGDVEGHIHVVTMGAYNKGLYDHYLQTCLYDHYLQTFDHEGNQKKSVGIGQSKYFDYATGLFSARIDDMDMIVLSTYSPRSIQIRQSHDGKLIDSLPLNGFEPAYNAICMTPDNNILVWSSNGEVREFQVRNMKIVQRQKTLNLPIHDVHGLCHVTHDDRQLVIATSLNKLITADNHTGATSYNPLIIAVDYHTGDVVWKKEQPLCEYKPINPMAIIHDGEGHLFICDVLDREICIMTPDGEIHHSLLKNPNAGYIRHLAWLPDQRRLVAIDKRQWLYLYDISYEQN